MFDIENHGSIVLLRPLTKDVRTWLVQHTDDEAIWFGNALCVEPRYVEDLIRGLYDAGFAAQ